MKLLYRITLHLSIIFIIVMSIWAASFYVAIMDEINNEVDDSLEDYSNMLINKFLAGDSLPSRSNGLSNQYIIRPVDFEYAYSRSHILYRDEEIFSPIIKESIPSRILTIIFRNKDSQYFELSVSASTIEKDDLQEAILFWVIFLYVTLLIIVIAVNIFVFYKSTRPLYKLLYWLDNYKVGSENQPLMNETNVTEFRKLNESAVRNMQRAETAFDEQKQFIGNASHEIQTPIAVCMNRIELLMDNDDLSEEQLGELIKTHNTLEYISKLNQSLLLLSKIDNRQFEEKQRININQTINKFLPDYQEIYSDIQIDLSEKNTLWLNMNESLAGILISNLLKNCCVHNIEHGIAEIIIDSHSVLFRNTGSNTHLDKNHIFDRFYQGNKKEGSTGLGLAIVHSICSMENLLITYRFINKMHEFEIRPKKLN